MTDKTIKRKVEVFISSKCGGEYTFVRKALMSLLEESNLANVYVFEEEPASSVPAIDAYINGLDHSDLVIFIIRNIDGISEGVLKEHKRARALEKRSLYFFCGENGGEATYIEKELIQNDIAKCQRIDHFSDIPLRAYRAMLTDIIEIYRWPSAKNAPKDNTPTNYAEKEINLKSSTDVRRQRTYTGTSELPFDDYRDLSKKFPRTTSVIMQLLAQTNDLAEPSGSLDRELSMLLQRLLGQIELKELPSFDVIISEIQSQSRVEYRDLINTRWGVIRSYFAGEIDNCVLKLKEIFELVKNDVAIPEWVVSDILIDLRNQILMQNNLNNILCPSSEAQSSLDSLLTPVYYPLLDRLSGDVSEDALDELIKAQTKSPYTIHMGSSLSSIGEAVSSIYIISCLHGSLTHILLAPDRLKKVLQAYCLQFSDHDLFISLLGILVQLHQQDRYESFIRSFAPPSDFISCDDAKVIWCRAERTIIPHDRFCAKLLAWGMLCDYFSDSQFTEISEVMFIEIETWIKDDSRVVNDGWLIFDTLSKVAVRSGSEQVLKLLCSAIDMKMNRFADKIHLAIQHICYADVSQNGILCLLDRLFEQCDSENKDNYHRLPELLLHIRLNKLEFVSRIDAKIAVSYPAFFATTYESETTTSLAILRKHIKRYVDQVHERNENQGKNGSFSSYSYDACNVLLSIIKNNPKVLHKSINMTIAEAAKETILSQSQMIDAKIAAIHLLETLWAFLDHNKRKDLNPIFSQIVLSQQSLVGHAGFFSTNSVVPLSISVGFLSLINNVDDINPLIERIMFIDRNNVRDILFLLEEFRLLLELDVLQVNNELVIGIIVQFCFEMSTNKEIVIRKAAVKVLVQATKTSYRDMCIHRLSTMMDSDSADTKMQILIEINNTFPTSNELFNYIIQKGVVDNSFRVRRYASRLTLAVKNTVNKC